MRILFLASAHNSLSQRAWIALTELGHDVGVEVVDSGAAMEAAVATHRPDLVVCPMLKKLIPESVWSTHRCLVVHPGPLGDRGPSSLDWAIESGAVGASRTFPMRAAGKSSLYRHEVRRAAVEAIVEAMERIVEPGAAGVRVAGEDRPLMTQDARAIDWSTDPTDTVVRKLRAAEGHPGVLDTVQRTEFHLFGVHRERGLRGAPGAVIAQRDGAICRATVDGAVWITHLKRAPAGGRTFFKLPATRALALAGHAPAAPELPAPLDAPIPPGHTYREIHYEEAAGVGYLYF